MVSKDYSYSSARIEMRRVMRLGMVGALLATLWAGRVPLRAQDGSGDAEQARKVSTLELLQNAHTLFGQGDYEAARKYYLQVLPSYPRNFDILKNLGYCFYVTGPHGYAQAAYYYQRAFEVNPESFEVANTLSKSLIGLNRNLEAAEVLRKMTGMHNAPPEVWRSLAQAYDAAHKVPEAEAAYDAYVQRRPGDLTARVDLGNLYTREKAFPKAAEQFRVVLSANPNYSPALVGMARLQAYQNQFDESLRLYDRVLRLNPNNSEALTGKAFVLLWTGRPEEAEVLFSKLHYRFPRDAEVNQGLQESEAALAGKPLAEARRTGNVAEIEAYYRQSLAKNPKDIMALKALAAFTADTKRCSESIDFSRRALDISPKDSTLELRLARSLVLCQQYAESEARYRRYLEAQPKAEDALYELGSVELKSRNVPGAIEVFRNLLQINPANTDAQLGLAEALASSGNYSEATVRYDQVLKTSPQSYDALQGKAYALYWTGQFAQSRDIFQSLAAERPSDPANSQALEDIAKAEEAARWAALRPPPGAPPEAFLQYYQKRLASYPNDPTAMKALAYLQAQMNNNEAAIRGYKQVVAMYPDDRDAKMELARLLSLDRQYDASIGLYQQVLKTSPDDPTVQENLARVYVWAGQPQDALPLYRGLLAKNPGNTGYQLQVARLELAVKNYPAARSALTSLLAADPQNREGRLELASLDLNQGQLQSSLDQYEALLKQNPSDTDALLGKAEVSFRQGKIPEAYRSATVLVQQKPDNLSGVILLANIEHARGNRKGTLALLDQADKLSPNNPEVVDLRNRVRNEARVTLHTSASYAREIGPAGQFVLKDDIPAALQPNFEAVLGPLDRFPAQTGLPNEDLRLFSYGSTVGLSVIPKTSSFLSFTALPTDSPLGPTHAPTGISGATGASQFLYRQSTQFTSHFALRLGAGLVRFGPDLTQQLGIQNTGALKAVKDVFGLSVLDPSIQAQILSSPLHTATFSAIGLAGFTVAPVKKFSFDLDVSRAPLVYTPLSVKAGVIEQRTDGVLNFFPTSRTDLHIGYTFAHFTSDQFDHFDLTNLRITRLPVACINLPLSKCFLVTGQLVTDHRADNDQSHGGTVVLRQNLVRSGRFSLDAGYSGLAYGFAGRHRLVFLGFFNPSLYQQHLLTGRIYGILGGPLGYDIYGGVGLQQNGQGNALTRAVHITPTFTLKVSDHLTLGAGYSHYTSAQALGPLRGNSVQFTTDWKY